PPLILVGMWGMNFARMPQLGWTFGYPLALVALGLSLVLPLIGFKLRGWLSRRVPAPRSTPPVARVRRGAHNRPPHTGDQSMKASDLFVKALEAEGVEYVFGIPGEENLDLLESLRNSSIRLVLTRHEQAAGFVAATYGRLTGRAGACLATLGPGATNFVTAAAYAQLGAMPMFMITGQKPVKASRQGHFQIVDVVAMMQPLSKYTRQIVSADNIPARVREAFRRAEEERPGATHLELPEDIARDPSDAILIPASYSRRPIADDKAIVRAVETIQAAKRPLLMIGAAANRKTCSRMLAAFVERSGIPFFTTQMGKGVLDEHHPLWIGNATLSDGDFLHRA